MKNKKNKVSNQRVKKYGMLILVPLTIVVVLISIMSASFSWFSPSSQSGDTLLLNEHAEFRVESCSFSTFRGVYNQTDNSISYSSTKSTGSISVERSSKLFFKTVVTNSNENKSTNISLFFSQILLSNAIKGVDICVTYPSNTVRKLTADTNNDVPLIRNAYVKQNDHSLSNPGLLEIEWFVYNHTDSSQSINLDNIYLMYN